MVIQTPGFHEYPVGCDTRTKICHKNWISCHLNIAPGEKRNKIKQNIHPPQKKPKQPTTKKTQCI